MWVFRGRRKSAEEVIHKAVESVGEYEQANDHENLVLKILQAVMVLKAPEEGQYKINSNAAVFRIGVLG